MIKDKARASKGFGEEGLCSSVGRTGNLYPLVIRFVIKYKYVELLRKVILSVNISLSSMGRIHPIRWKQMGFLLPPR